MPFPSAENLPASMTTSRTSASSSLLSTGLSPDNATKRLSPSLSPVLSDHQLPALGSLSHRSSISSTSSTSLDPTAASARASSPPIRALRRRSKSVASFSHMLQHCSSLPVLMKPYGANTASSLAIAKPGQPLSDTCSPLNIPTDATGLPSLHPCLSPSVMQTGGGGGAVGLSGRSLPPRSKSFSVYEDEQSASQQRGRINARLPAMRVARIAERPAVHVIFDKKSREQQQLSESAEAVEGEGEQQQQVAGEMEYPTCPVNPLLSPIVEADKEFFSPFSP